MWPDEVPQGWRPPDGQPDADAALRTLLEARRKSSVAA
jgi:hypothetical protein